MNKHYHMRKGSNGVKWLEGYHRTIRILTVPGGCSWHDKYLGTTVREQVNHGILNSSSDEESVPSYDDDGWYDDEYWYGDVPSCGGTTNSHGVMRVLCQRWVRGTSL